MFESVNDSVVALIIRLNQSIKIKLKQLLLKRPGWVHNPGTRKIIAFKVHNCLGRSSLNRAQCHPLPYTAHRGSLLHHLAICLYICKVYVNFLHFCMEGSAFIMLRRSHKAVFISKLCGGKMSKQMYGHWYIL